MHKRTKEEKSILKTILIAPILFIFTLGFLASSITFFSKYEEFKTDSKKIEEEFFNSAKKELNQELSRIYNIVDYENSITKKRLKKEIKEKVYEAYFSIEKIYEEGTAQGLSKNEIIKKVKDTLRFIRFNNQRGYFFIYKMNGECLLLPPAAKLEGKNLWDLQDSKGKFTIREMSNLVKTKDEGFYRWHWYKPNQKDTMSEKIGFGKYFKPLDIFVGTGDYVEDVREDIKKELVGKLERFRFEDDRIFWIVSSDFTLISHPSKKHLIGKKVVYEVDAHGDAYIRDIVNKAVDSDLENFSNYTLLNSSGEEEDILTFARYYHAFDWIIITQRNTKEVLSMLEKKRKELNRSLEEELWVIFTISSTLLIISIVFSIVFNKKIQRRFANYTKLIDKKNSELKLLNDSLEIKVMEEVRKNREQERILISQSRLAAIGETMVLIAHHWRQPLNVIALIIQDLKDNPWGEKEKEIIDSTVDDVVKQTTYLSKTVDSFRNFYAPNSKKEFFEVEDIIQTAIDLLKPSTKERIVFKVKGTASTVYGYKNEFSQVVMNLVKNAKESIEKRQKEEVELKGEVEILFEDIERKVRVSIGDNGVGINEEIKEKIFTPYFTTKFQAKGTGLGLYMSKMVAEKSMGGSLDFKNLEQGTKFVLEIERESR